MMHGQKNIKLMVEPGIEPGTSWLVVRSSDHQATRMVIVLNVKEDDNIYAMSRCSRQHFYFVMHLANFASSEVHYRANSSS